MKLGRAATLWLAAGAVCGTWAAPALADDATGMRSTKVESRLITHFRAFAGSKANARSLVSGLRTGGPIVLTEPGARRPAVAFEPPTRPMDNRDVFISLELARRGLAKAGITRPTVHQVRTALMGGKLATGSGASARTLMLPGVLTQRSQGLGWGHIARSQRPDPTAAGSTERAERGLANADLHLDERGEGMVTPRFEPRVEGRPGAATALSTDASGRGMVTALGTAVGPSGTGRSGASGLYRGAPHAPGAGSPSSGIVSRRIESR